MTHRPLYVRTSQGFLRRTQLPTRKQKARIRAEVYRRDLFACQVCGISVPDPGPSWNGQYALWTNKRGPLHLDHIKPYKDGGEFTVENLRVLCEKCNCQRGSRPIEEV